MYGLALQAGDCIIVNKPMNFKSKTLREETVTYRINEKKKAV